MDETAPPFHVVTGGPGAGKSTLVVAGTHEAMVETYSALGYAPVEAPRAPVAARIDFMLEAIRA